MSGKVYFGTLEKMQWVKAPATGVNLGREGWIDTQTDLSGGSYAHQSAWGAKRFEFSWGASPSDEVYAITDYRSGVWGSGLLYYVDPFAMDANVLPDNFSIPWKLKVMSRMGYDASLTPVDALPTVRNLPRGYRFFLGQVSPWVTIPIPPGYTLHVAYSATTNALQRRYPNNTTGTVTATTAAAANWTWTAFNSTSYAHIALRWSPTASTDIYGAIAVLLPTGQSPAVNKPWCLGRGNWGLAFAGEPQISGISAALGDSGGLVSGSVSLLEVGLDRN